MNAASLRVFFISGSLAVGVVTCFFLILSYLTQPEPEPVNLEYTDVVKWYSDPEDPALEEEFYVYPYEGETDLEFIIRHGTESSAGFDEAELIVLHPGLPSETKKVIERLGKPVATLEGWKENQADMPKNILWILGIKNIERGVYFRATFGDRSRFGRHNCGTGSTVAFKRLQSGRLVAPTLSRSGFRC